MIETFKKYGLFGGWRLLCDVIITRLFFKNCRIVRRPYYIRGKNLIKFNEGFTSGVGTRLDAFGDKNHGCLIEFGKNVEINDYVHIAAIESVYIGNNVLIASKVFISDHNHGNYTDIREEHSSPLIVPKERKLISARIIIDDNAWIGEFVSILPGVKIGKGAIIGTMSVVTKDIPPYTIAVGSPAKVIKVYNFESQKWEKTT